MKKIRMLFFCLSVITIFKYSNLYSSMKVNNYTSINSKDLVFDLNAGCIIEYNEKLDSDKIKDAANYTSSQANTFKVSNLAEPNACIPSKFRWKDPKSRNYIWASTDEITFKNNSCISLYEKNQQQKAGDKCTRIEMTIQKEEPIQKLYDARHATHGQTSHPNDEIINYNKLKIKS